MKWTRLKRMPSARLSEASLEPSNYRMSASLAASLLEVLVVESRRVLSVRGGNPEINIVPRCFWLSKRASPSSRPTLQKIAVFVFVLVRSSSRNQRRVREVPKMQRRFISRAIIRRLIPAGCRANFIFNLLHTEAPARRSRPESETR